MRIGELAAKVAMKPSAIRFYEQAGLLPPPERTPAGYRNYEPDVLPLLDFIRGGQAIGLTLAELKDIIAFRHQGIAPCEHVAALIDAHAQEIARTIHELELIQAELTRLSVRAQGLDPAACGPDQVCHLIPQATEVTDEVS